jgi:hypothetical protein
MRPFFVGVFVLTSVLVASTASAQLADLARQLEVERTATADKTYTNADLRPPLAQPASGTDPIGSNTVVITARPIVRIRSYVLDPTRFRVSAAPPPSRTTVIHGSPSSGPFGEFKPFEPARRLDGTSIDGGPAVYGPNVVVVPTWWIR